MFFTTDVLPTLTVDGIAMAISRMLPAIFYGRSHKSAGTLCLNYASTVKRLELLKLFLRIPNKYHKFVYLWNI